VQEVEAALQARAPWVLEDGMLVLEIRDAPFSDIAGLVREILVVAEELDHHPDVGFGYNWLRVSTLTHDAGGITEKDLACADRILKRLAS
jgi:4a-hydroxytetrahydrobiopterin dehydratase